MSSEFELVFELESELKDIRFIRDGILYTMAQHEMRCAELETELSRAGEGLEAEKAEKERLSELVRNQTLTLAEYEKNTHELKTKESSPQFKNY